MHSSCHLPSHCSNQNLTVTTRQDCHGTSVGQHIEGLLRAWGDKHWQLGVQTLLQGLLRALYGGGHHRSCFSVLWRTYQVPQEGYSGSFHNLKWLNLGFCPKINKDNCFMFQLRVQWDRFRICKRLLLGAWKQLHPLTIPGEQSTASIYASL